MPHRYLLILGFLATGGLLLCCATFAAAVGTDTAPHATCQTASGRTVFWRGEAIAISFSAPLTAASDMSATIAATTTPQATPPRPLYHGRLTPVHGIGYGNFLLPTAQLGDGQYTVTVRAGGQRATTTVTVRETTTSSPGMILDESGFALAPNAPLARQTGAINLMTDGRMNFTGPVMSETPAALNTGFDRLMAQQVLFWTQDSTRPFSFYPPYLLDNTDGEYLRRMLLGNAVLLRYPGFGGQLYDYDPTGFLGHYQGLVTYWGWGNDTLREKLKQYLSEQEQTLYATFREKTGLEPLTGAEALRLAAATNSPEAMGYIDMPTRRWAAEIAAHSPPMPTAELAALKARAAAWYGFLMTLNARRYTRYQQALHALDGTLMNSTSNTINHSKPRDGAYHAASYQPLDFRFVAVWDDQGGAPEHIYETTLAATLLNADRSPAQPLWIDTSSGWLNGNIFRNSLLLAGRGAQGAGYAMEMGASLLSNQQTVETNGAQNREYDVTGRFFERFGSVLTRTTATPRLALLYSKRQCIITPYAQSYVDGMLKVIYLLSHVALPPALLTEDTLENGVPVGTDVIIVLGQTEPLSDTANTRLREFVARGGRVIVDSATECPWTFAERSAALDMPRYDLGHPYNAMTAYNRQDATVGELEALAAARCPQLRALLQGAITSLPLDATNPNIALCTLDGGAARFVTVANDAMLDFTQTFTDAQQRSTAGQQFFVGHGIGAIGSWMPVQTDLLLNPALPQAAVYDLFRTTRVPVVRKGGARVITCDMTTTPGGFFAVYPRAVGAGELQATQTVTAGTALEVHYRATDTRGQGFAAVTPVEIWRRSAAGVESPHLFRATDDRGQLTVNLPTGAFDSPGSYELYVRQLLDGQTVILPVTIQAAPAIPASAIAAATVRDPGGIRDFLRTNPEIVVPVLDPALASRTAALVVVLQRQGVHARLWNNPPMVDYTLAYAVSAAERERNEAVTHGEALGKVLFANMVHHVNGNFYGSAMTGYRYGKHLLLLGLPGKNPVLDGMKASGLLWTDAATETPGAALVQRIPWALGLRADTLVIQGSDLSGIDAGIAALLNLPAHDATTDGVRAARTALLRQRALPLTAHESPSGRRLTAVGRQALPATALPENAFGLTPITSVQEQDKALVVALARYGNMAAVVDRDGQVTTLPAISSTTTLACGKTIIVTATPRLTCAWSHDGQLLWRALGEYQMIVPQSDDVVVDADGTRYRLTPAGEAFPFSVTATPLAAPPPAFTVEISTDGPNGQGNVKAIQIRHARTGKVITGLTLSAARANWSAPYSLRQQCVMHPNGDALLVFRRDVGERLVQWYTAGRDQVSSLTLNTAYLTDAAFSRDGTLVAACGVEGDVLLAGIDGRQIAVVHTGPYPHLFPLSDGGFAVGSADARLTVITSTGKVRLSCDLGAATKDVSLDTLYQTQRAGKLLTWATIPAVGGPVPLNQFFWYLRDGHGDWKMVNWTPGAAVDFRWMDAVQGQVRIPESKTYRVTIRAAAKYQDEEPMGQASWMSFIAMRQQVIGHDRPAPAFRIYQDGKLIGTLAPRGEALVKYTTITPKEGWAILQPTAEQLTTFTGACDLAAGDHLLGIEAVNMQDCYMANLAVE